MKSEDISFFRFNKVESIRLVIFSLSASVPLYISKSDEIKSYSGLLSKIFFWTSSLVLIEISSASNIAIYCPLDSYNPLFNDFPRPDLGRWITLILFLIY